MITIQNGKLLIPDDDRFVGFAGDNAVNTKRFLLPGHAEEGCTYTLCLRFDDDTVCSAPLNAVIEDGDTVLTWEIRGEQLCAPGIVTAQLKTVGSDGSIAHSTKDFFFVGSSVELDEDGAEREYVTPSQLKNSINQALQTLSSTAPYVGDDGCWYVYDPEKGAYVGTGYHVSGLEPDGEMSDSSANAAENRVIKRYVDDQTANCNAFAKTYTDLKTADKVSSATTVAGLPLTADVSARSLSEALRPFGYRSAVVPGVTAGNAGLMGIGPNGEMYFCSNDNKWVRLMTDEDASGKMDRVEEIPSEDADLVENGNLYLSDGRLYLRYDDESLALVSADEVYTKAEIDAMVGAFERILREL